MRRKAGRFLAGCMAATIVMSSSYVPVSAEGTDTDAKIAPKAGTYGYYVENSEKNKNTQDSTDPELDPSVNPSTGVLSQYLALWTPGDSWGNGTKQNEDILNENIRKAYEIAGSRTEAQAQAAYDDEFNNQNYSMVSGLGKYADAFIEKSGIGTDKTKWNVDSSAELYDMVDLVDLFRNRTAASTNGAKAYYSYPRPYRWDLSTQTVIDETITGDNGSTQYKYVESQVVPAIAEKKGLSTKSPEKDGGFPSGHTNAAYLGTYALAYAVPEQYDELLMRAADLGNNRIVAGMHSPLDVMGGRMTATAVAAAALYNDTDGVADKAYETAHTSLVTDTTVETASAEAYENYQKNLSQYIYYLTYDFEQIGDTTKEMTVPKGAENLIKTRLPYLSDEERRYVLYTTGLESGYPLLDDAEGWGRLNLYEAVHGYGALVKDVTVTMDASKGGYYAKDNWLNDIEGTGALTKEGTGELVLAGNNSYTGGTTVNGGTLTVTNSNGLGAGEVVNNSVLAEETSGAVQIKSNYVQKDGAKLVLNISGKEDVLKIDGTANLDGTLEINFTDGFVPVEGTVVISAGNVTGTFDNVTVNGAETQLKVTYGTNGVTFENAQSGETGNTPGETEKAPEETEKTPGETEKAPEQTGETVKKGDIYTIANYKYKVTKTTESGGTVTLTGVKKKVANVTVSATVKIEGKNYKVTAIGDKVFKNNKKMTKLTIGSNVQIIGKEAFSGCVNVKTIKIGANVKTIGKKAFYNCKKVSSMTISTKKLTSKTVGSSAFSKMGSADYKKLKVKVPSAKLKGYKKLLTAKGLSTKATVKK